MFKNSDKLNIFLNSDVKQCLAILIFCLTYQYKKQYKNVIIKKNIKLSKINCISFSQNWILKYFSFFSFLNLWWFCFFELPITINFKHRPKIAFCGQERERSFSEMSFLGSEEVYVWQLRKKHGFDLVLRGEYCWWFHYFLGALGTSEAKMSFLQDILTVYLGDSESIANQRHPMNSLTIYLRLHLDACFAFL